MKLILTCFLTFAIVAALNGKFFRCDYNYFKKTDGWLKFHKIPANWTDARLRCRLEGGKLASPSNSDLASIMRETLDQAAIGFGLYTGIHSYFSKGDFHTIEGTPLSKIPHTWAPGEPDNYNDGEECLMMLNSGALADVNCSEPLPYMCYKEATRTIATNCGTLDTEYNFESRTGSCYKFHKVPRTWSRAYMACAAEGGHLAIINNDTEAQVIREIYSKNPSAIMRGIFEKDYAFVGFHDWGEHGDFLTIEGQTLDDAGYAKFPNGRPNYALAQYCGSVDRSAQLIDLHCGVLHPFICEKIPDSLLCEDNSRESR